MRFVNLSILTILLVNLVSGCSHSVIEKTTSGNDRPTINFIIEDENLYDSVVYVNGINMGNAKEYLFINRQELMLVSGSHLVEIKEDNLTIMSEKIFIRDGTTKSIRIVR